MIYRKYIKINYFCTLIVDCDLDNLHFMILLLLPNSIHSYGTSQVDSVSYIVYLSAGFRHHFVAKFRKKPLETGNGFCPIQYLVGFSVQLPLF